MTERILTLRELNRATLARQFLLERSDLTPFEVLTHLVAHQAQDHNEPYTGLWTRLRSFERAELSGRLESRQVVKGTLLRSTLHIMTADDFIAFRLILQPALSRALQPFFATGANGLERAAFVEELRAYIREQPRTGAELRAKFGELFPGLNAGHMSDALRAQLPLVQIFPSGTWGFTGKPMYSEAEDWLGRSPVESTHALSALVLRYLAAFGPASVRDMQTWSGLTGLQKIVQALRPQLLTFRDEQGRELFDLPDAPRPPEDTPAPVRFLSVFDNLLLSYADRCRILNDADKPAVFTSNGLVLASILIDGFVGGRWKITRERAITLLLLELFAPPTPQQRQELLTEGTRLMHWLLDGAGTFDILFTG